MFRWSWWFYRRGKKAIQEIGKKIIFISCSWPGLCHSLIIFHLTRIWCQTRYEVLSEARVVCLERNSILNKILPVIGCRWWTIAWFCSWWKSDRTSVGTGRWWQIQTQRPSSNLLSIRQNILVRSWHKKLLTSPLLYYVFWQIFWSLTKLYWKLSHCMSQMVRTNEIATAFLATQPPSFFATSWKNMEQAETGSIFPLGVLAHVWLAS